jgi:hypothetical protein
MAILGACGPIVAAAILLLPAGQPEGSVPGSFRVSVQDLVSAAGTVRAGRVHSVVPVRPEGLEVLFGAMNPGQARTFATLGRKGEIVGSGDRVIRFSEREMLETVGLRKVMRFWFDVGGRSYSGSAVAKAALALKAPLGTRFMTIHAVEAQCSRNCDAARALLDQYMRVGF